MVSFADGGTISIVQPIRMLSCDTPEKEGFAGRAETVQPHLDRCAGRLRGDFYAAISGPMREYLLERLDGEAAVRYLRAGHGASARFEILLAERLTLPDGAKRRGAVMPGGDLIDTYGRLLAYFAPYYRNTAADPLPEIGDPRRHTLNLNMISEGWAAFFPVYPGARVIYLWLPNARRFVLFMLYTKARQADIPPAIPCTLADGGRNHQRQIQPMKTKTKKREIEFDANALLSRVEGFAVGREPAVARTVKLPPPVKPIPEPTQ